MVVAADLAGHRHPVVSLGPLGRIHGKEHRVGRRHILDVAQCLHVGRDRSQPHDAPALERIDRNPLRIDRFQRESVYLAAPLLPEPIGSLFVDKLRPEYVQRSLGNRFELVRLEITVAVSVHPHPGSVVVRVVGWEILRAALAEHDRRDGDPAVKTVDGGPRIAKHAHQEPAAVPAKHLDALLANVKPGVVGILEGLKGPRHVRPARVRPARRGRFE